MKCSNLADELWDLMKGEIQVLTYVEGSYSALLASTLKY
jgi:hypothetical protein